MKQSRSRFLQVRGLSYHVREWGREGAPKLFLLHGHQDVSASYQFLVDELRGDWHVLAPDWRGCGLTGWAGVDGYGFPEYLADLDFLLSQLQPEGPVNLFGHSMGGNISALYSGARPERVKRLVLLDSQGLRNFRLEEAPQRYRGWLQGMSNPGKQRDHADFAALARRLHKNAPRLSMERAAFLAEHWGRETAAGRVALRDDPANRLPNPSPFRIEHSKGCWRQITAPVLSIEGDYAHTTKRLRTTVEEIERRRELFRDMRVVFIPDAGHMLHHEYPERIAAHIEPFLLGE